MPPIRNAASSSLFGAGELRRRWLRFFGIGIVLATLGVTTVALASLLNVGTAILVGTLLIAVGIIQTLPNFPIREWGGFLIHSLAATLYLVVGLLIVTTPTAATEASRLLITVLLIFGGIFGITVALLIRLLRNALWLLLHGVVDLALGVMMWSQWPTSGHGAMGVFVGIDLIFSGWSFVMLGVAARRLRLE